MRFNFSDDQVQVRDAIGAFLGDRYDHHSRERIVKAPGSWSPDIWQAFASELGMLGLAFPEDVGGMGGDAIDVQLVMDAVGEALVVEPVLETCVLGAALLNGSGSPLAAELMKTAVAGEARFALAIRELGARFAPHRTTVRATPTDRGFVIDGRKSAVIAAPAATHLFVTARLADDERAAIFAVPNGQAGIEMKCGRTLDGKGVAEVAFSGCAVTSEALLVPPESGAETIDLMLDAGTAAICAEAGGIMRRMIRDTLDYLSQRKQFGTALVDFQVLQHRLADMQVRYEQVCAMAFFAAEVLEDAPDRRKAGISAAKVFVGNALRLVAQDAVQLHGAMGMTEELPIGHLFKRATAIENEFGSVDYHLARVVALGLPVLSMAQSRGQGGVPSVGDSV